MNNRRNRLLIERGESGMRVLLSACALAVLLAEAWALPMYAVRPKAAPASAVIYRLNDDNGDGDALDAGERRMFRSSSGMGPSTDDFNGVAVGRSGFVYAIENFKGRVLRMRDNNADGDAQDVGETTVFRNPSDAGLALQLPQSIAVSQTYDPDSGLTIDVVYVLDVGLQAVIRLQDLDNDGDARSNDEACMFHRSSPANPISALQIATTESGEIVAANHNLRIVLGLVDLTGDCHTEGDRRETQCPPQFFFNEYHLIRNNSPPGPDLLEPYGIGVDSNDVMYIGDPGSPAVTVNKHIQRLEDLDYDYTALGDTEGTFFHSGACGNQAFRTPGPVAVDEKNLVYVGDLVEGIVVVLDDANSDKDALDANECRLFADGMVSVVSLSAQLPPLPPPAINFVSGVVDIGKEYDLLLPPGDTREFKVLITNAVTNSRLPDTKVRCDSMTGCLECDPHVDRTDADGMISFKVTRLGPPDDEALIVSTLGAHEIINVPSFVPEEDSDLDDIPDSADNCPGDPNPNQEDADGDGMGDICDSCPNGSDLNGNSFVDLVDFKQWPPCLLGPETPTTAACACMNLDGDNDADLYDYSIFARQFTGP